MNRTKFLVFLIVASLIPISACKKNSTGPNGGGTNTKVMTATVDGRSWAGIIPFVGTRNGYYDFSAGDSVSDIFMYYTQTDTGTFPVNGNTGDDLWMTYDTGAGANDHIYVSYANSGSVHFTTNDSNHVVGTFNFKAINMDSPFDTATITNGTFNIYR